MLLDNEGPAQQDTNDEAILQPHDSEHLMLSLSENHIKSVILTDNVTVLRLVRSPC